MKDTEPHSEWKLKTRSSCVLYRLFCMQCKEELWFHFAMLRIMKLLRKRKEKLSNLVLIPFYSAAVPYWYLFCWVKLLVPSNERTKQQGERKLFVGSLQLTNHTITMNTACLTCLYIITSILTQMFFKISLFLVVYLPDRKCQILISYK